MFDFEEKRNIAKLYKNKKILPSDRVSILQQIDALGDLEVYKLLYFISDFERENYWESAINRFDENQKSAMHHCVDLLIAAHPHKPRKPKPVRLSPADWKIKNENPWYRAVRIFLSLINAGASVNSRKIHQFDIYQTPLKYAISQGAPRDVLELLIKHGAFVDEFEFCCHTPLMSAIYYMDDVAVEVLLNAGADPNAEYEDGSPLLHQVLKHLYGGADFKTCRRIIEMLLAHGANPNVFDYNMENCVEYDLWKYGASRWERERDMGIGQEMIILRRLFKKYGRKHKHPARSRAKYIRAHTWHGIDNETGRKTRDSKQAERTYRLIENADLMDDINLHLLQRRPISQTLFRRVMAMGPGIPMFRAMLPLCEWLDASRADFVAVRDRLAPTGLIDSGAFSSGMTRPQIDALIRQLK